MLFLYFVFLFYFHMYIMFDFFFPSVLDQILRWETLRLDAPLSDDAWNGEVGFDRALANPACFAEFRQLLR